MKHYAIMNLIDELLSRPIAYQKIYTKITGSLASGVLLSQLVYWSKAMKGKSFYKTNEDFREELGIALDEFKAAKKNLENLGLISLEYKGIPRKTYYTVHMDEILKNIVDIAENLPVGGNSTNKLEEDPPTITESIRDTPYSPPLEDRTLSQELSRSSMVDMGKEEDCDPPSSDWLKLCENAAARNEKFKGFIPLLKMFKIENSTLYLIAKNRWVADWCSIHFKNDIVFAGLKLKLGFSDVCINV